MSRDPVAAIRRARNAYKAAQVEADVRRARLASVVNQAVDAGDLTWQQVADEFGISRPTAWQRFKGAQR